MLNENPLLYLQQINYYFHAEFFSAVSYTVAWNKYPKQQKAIERVLHRTSLQGLGYIKDKQLFLPQALCARQPRLGGNLKDLHPCFWTLLFLAADPGLRSVPSTVPQHFGRAVEDVPEGRMWPRVFIAQCCSYTYTLPFHSCSYKGTVSFR